MPGSSQFGQGTFGGSPFGGTAVPGPDKGLVPIVRQLLDQTSGDVFWSAQQIYDASNEALVDLWASAKTTITHTPFVVGTGADIVAYNTSTIMIPQFVVLSTTVLNATKNQEYFITDRTKLEQWSRVWRQATPGQPKWFVLWDKFSLRVFPSPDKTYSFDLWGVAWPQEIDASNEDAPVDRQLKLAIAYKIASNLLEHTRPDTADVYMKMSEEAMTRWRTRNRNIQKNNMRRLKPGVGSRQTDRTIGAMTGVIKIGQRLP